MLKGYKYNQSYRIIRRKSVYAQEHDLLHGLLASKNDNIAFEYASVVVAKNASLQIKRYVDLQKMPIAVKQRHERVVAIRTDGQRCLS